MKRNVKAWSGMRKKMKKKGGRRRIEPGAGTGLYRSINMCFTKPGFDNKQRKHQIDKTLASSLYILWRQETALHVVNTCKIRAEREHR